jgi:cytochrome c556
VEENMTLGLNKRNVLALALTGCVLFGVSTHHATAADTALPEYRDNVMASLEGHVKAAGLIVNDKVPFWHHLPDHAVAIVGTSRGLLEVFPDKVKAADASQKNGKDKAGSPPFPMLAAQFNHEAARLVQLAPTGDKAAIKAQYEVMMKAYEAVVKATNEKSEEKGDSDTEEKADK